MQLISYVKTNTNKRLLISDSRGDSNRCTTCRRKPDQHATHFPRSVRVWLSIIRISHGSRIATFCELSMGLDGCTAPEKKFSWLDLSTRLSGLWDPPQFLSQHNHWSSALKPSTCWRQATRLTGPYHQHTIGTFNTCSRGATHHSLTDTSGGYNLGGVGLPHQTSRPSEPTVLHFPPKGLARSQVIHPTITNWSKEGTNPTSHEWEPPLDFYQNLTSKHSVS
jgi:hypothetical protein